MPAKVPAAQIDRFKKKDWVIELRLKAPVATRSTVVMKRRCLALEGPPQVIASDRGGRRSG